VAERALLAKLFAALGYALHPCRIPRGYLACGPRGFWQSWRTAPAAGPARLGCGAGERRPAHVGQAVILTQTRPSDPTRDPARRT
jgi:hypothetical protein